MKVKYCLIVYFVNVVLKRNFNHNLEIEASRMIELCLCIIKGVERIHQIGIAHRDLKTKNVSKLLLLLLILIFSILGKKMNESFE